MLIDSHCHLDFDVFNENRDALMAQCLEQDILGFLVPATTYSSWKKLQTLVSHYPQWRGAYGLHPYFLEEASLCEIEHLGDQCEASQALAIGEIGLDNWPGSVDMDLQVTFFCRQLAVSKALGLPIIVHSRKSYDLVLKYLRQADFKCGGVVHAFNGSLEQAKRFLDMGFVLGIGGTITYPRAKKSHRVLSALEREAFVFETDSPDMPLNSAQGQINTPLSVPIIAECAAQIRGETLEQITEQTYDNLLRVFPRWHEGLV